MVCVQTIIFLNYFTKALLVIRRLLQTVPKEIWGLFKEYIKWCCDRAAHLDWGIQTLMESGFETSWSMPSQTHCLPSSPKETCSNSSQVTVFSFYKSHTFEFFPQKGWEYPCRSVPGHSHSPDTGSHRAKNLHFLEREDISLVGLVSGTNFLRLLLFLKWQRWKEKSHSMNSTWNIFFTWIREKNKAFFPFFFFDNYLLNFWFSYGIEKSIIHTLLLSSCLC